MKLDAETIRKMLEEDEFGILEAPKKEKATTSDDRLVSRFQEILQFVEKHGRPPEESITDLAERRMANRLKAINESEEHRTALKPYDTLGLLKEPKAPTSIEEILDGDEFDILLGGNGEQDLFDLKHVPDTASQQAPDRVAQRRPCKDFEIFAPLFESCQAEIKAGVRQLVPFDTPSHIEEGKFFVQAGVLLYVAKVGELEQRGEFKDARTLCIYENGTESDLLLRSLARVLYNDGRKVTESPERVLAERMGIHPDTKMGTVYVLRSLSDEPQLRQFTDLHKIGYTSQKTETRVANASKDMTFLDSEVEIIAEYEMPDVMAKRVEHLLHDFFAEVRLDVWKDIHGFTVASANEWFDVPLEMIDQAMCLIESEQIVHYQYSPSVREIRLKG